MATKMLKNAKIRTAGQEKKYSRCSTAGQASQKEPKQRLSEGSNEKYTREKKKRGPRRQHRSAAPAHPDRIPSPVSFPSTKPGPLLNTRPPLGPSPPSACSCQTILPQVSLAIPVALPASIDHVGLLRKVQGYDPSSPCALVSSFSVDRLVMFVRRL